MPPARNAEQNRIAAADTGRAPWRRWGPYLSERAWGTVREDYSAGGDAWAFFPHDQARSRTYRWNDDGMAGICDDAQRWCFGLALWNGADPILKERMFGLTGTEGNHGEDAKEYWWYEDSTPTHSWMRWRYHYPQAAFPYEDLLSENQHRGRLDPEYELLDTGVFAGNRFWAVTVDYAKAGPEDLLIKITVENKGPEAASIQVLPTLWFRNTWAWGIPGQEQVPQISAADGFLAAAHPLVDPLTLSYSPGASPLFCDNETNTERLWSTPGRSAYPKDGINDHVVHGASTVNPANTGTKAALQYVLAVPAGGTSEIRLRLASRSDAADLGRTFTTVMTNRLREADDFYAAVAPADATDEQKLVLRQAFAGMLWGKQFYHYDVSRWLDGDPAGPPPPPGRDTGRNRDWRHVNNHDVISMPDAWEYPWYAGWDLSFHCITLAHVDPGFAKAQLLLLCREWYMHPNGQLPAYEWAFGDVNPPVQALAALRVFEIDGGTDYDFLERIFQKLLLNFTWWVNRKDSEGNDLFEGGFLGLDNISPIDRSAPLPIAGNLQQSDGTAWMAMYCLHLWEIAIRLAEHDIVYEDMAIKFFEHFAYIATAARALWDEQDGFFYDEILLPDGETIPLRVRSIVGLLPLCATTTIGVATLARLPTFAKHMEWFLANKTQYSSVCVETDDGSRARLVSLVDREQLTQLLVRLLDDGEFLSDHGIRALSKAHRDDPFILRIGDFSAEVDYEPGESTSALFGGNSNWRGPIWFPVNFLIIEALRRFGRFYQHDLRVEDPVGSGTQLPLDAVADEIASRLVSLFVPDASGQRPADGARAKYGLGPEWDALVTFNEYFHGDTGAGLGASHQTGWTGLVADLIIDKN